MEFVIVLVVLAVVVFVVTAPLRRGEPSAPAAGASADGLGELEAEREAKYREIRDADLDHRTGKLSDADYEELDRTLRAEAVDIMHAIDRAQAAGSESSAGSPDASE